MPRLGILAVISMVAFCFLVGCAYVPGLSETGLLPGPPISVVARALPPEMLSDILGDYGDIGTQTCPVGEIWIGTLNVGDTKLEINACIDTQLATSYAQSFGLI
ncbi:MAG: hypothetical protein JXQ73_27925 [Phycisphaerae bacterium]|nr:hypothetical protein [Phycisphaerae bacterium]